MIRLRHRERTLGILGLALTGVLTLHGFVVRPTMARAETLHRVIPDKQKELQALLQQGREVADLRDRITLLRKRLAAHNQPLPAWIESQVKRSGLDRQVTQIQPQVSPQEGPYATDVVSVDLQAVAYTRLVEFLAAMDNPETLCRVTRIQVTPVAGQGDTVNASISIARPAPLSR